MAMAIVVSGNNSPRSSIFPTAPVPRSFATTFVRRHQLRSVRLQIRCISSNHLSTEFSGTYDSPSESHFSMLSPGVKRFQNVIVVILIFIHISYPLPLSNWIPWFISPARAVLYSPDTKVPRTGELALRKAIPANSNMKAIQNSLEEISYLLRIPQRKPYGTMEGDVKRALKIAMDEKESILGNIPVDLKEKGVALYASFVDGKGELQSLVESIKENDPDKVSIRLSSSLNTVAELELLQAPGLSFLLPKQYMGYPRLTGRGTVEFTIEKGDGSTFSSASSGEPRKNVTIQVVLDGYSAPLTAGNFAKLVIDGAYDGVKLKCTDQAVLPDNEVENSGYSVPLEIMPSGQFEPLYKTTLSVQAGLGGLSFEEGQFSVFGYTTVGREILPQIKTGDLIRSAKLVQGQDHLTLPVEK
ncbi:cyclophilin-like peptidyl-prolyl cis-trans isomerase family protein isoform X3 [Tasmannia lanceolata]|uniref:cyclophilin-like peptidyl-prolyl cis-trans isomerase family protein isoform X3 n=1 Tax=Tasmannia lanceolata TaxID=3420 RepID=UPI004063E175